MIDAFYVRKTKLIDAFYVRKTKLIDAFYVTSTLEPRLLITCMISCSNGLTRVS